MTLGRSTKLTVVLMHVTKYARASSASPGPVPLLDKDAKRVLAIGDPRVLRDSSDPRRCRFFDPLSKEKSAWQPPANYVKIQVSS